MTYYTYQGMLDVLKGWGYNGLDLPTTAEPVVTLKLPVEHQDSTADRVEVTLGLLTDDRKHLYGLTYVERETVPAWHDAEDYQYGGY